MKPLQNKIALHKIGNYRPALVAEHCVKVRCKEAFLVYVYGTDYSRPHDIKHLPNRSKVYDYLDSVKSVLCIFDDDVLTIYISSDRPLFMKVTHELEAGYNHQYKT